MGMSKILMFAVVLLIGLIQVQPFTNTNPIVKSPLSLTNQPVQSHWDNRQAGASTTAIFGKKEAREQGNDSKKKK